MAEEDRGEPGTVHQGDTYEGIVRMSLMRLGTNDPDGALRQTNDYWKKCQSIGIPPQTCAALIYETVKHRHQPSGEIILREPGAEAPTFMGEEWEVIIRRTPGGGSMNDLRAASGRAPDEVKGHNVIYGDFYDDEKARAFARKMTNAGFIAMYGPRKKPVADEGAREGASEKSALRWTEVWWHFPSDAEKFAKQLEKLHSTIVALAMNRIVRTNATDADIQRVIKKHRWEGEHTVYGTSRSFKHVAEEGDPSAMPTVVAVAAVTPAAAAEPTEVLMEPTVAVPWVKVTRDVERYEACVKTADKIGPIKDAKKVYELLGDALNKEDQEVFCVVLLNLRGELRGVCEVARGQRSRVAVGPADVLRPVITSGAEGFIVVHNHPTGKANPSKADRQLTDLIAEATKPYGKDVTFIDHVVIGIHQAFSICQNKMYKVR
jgi:RadC-like JAB domain